MAGGETLLRVEHLSMRFGGLVAVDGLSFAARAGAHRSFATGAVLVALLVAAAVLVVIAPWGVDSTSVFESVRQVFFGFRVGSISISFSTCVRSARPRETTSSAPGCTSLT